MTVSDFHGKPIVPHSVKHLDADVLVEVLSRHGVNVSEAAAELGVGSADLRRLLWANPKLSEAAVEIEERRLDLAERNIYEALKSDEPRRRDAASMFTLRNSHRARRRGWITTSTSAAELSVAANAPARTVVFRWRTDDDDSRDAELAEAERLRDEGKLIEHEAGLESSNKNKESDPRNGLKRLGLRGCCRFERPAPRMNYCQNQPSCST
jgi:hypothetical protein